jgi:putative DNA primase/helicase
LLFLSSGELSLADHMAESMKRARTGQEVRMADIPADAGKGMGVFECIHECASASEFAGRLTREAAACHGAAGLAFIEWACARWGELPKRLRAGVRALTELWVPPGADGQVQRVAERFALVGVVGELATQAGLTGWDGSESEWAARACFDAWLSARGGAGSGEVTAMLRQVRGFLAMHGEGRFTWLHRGADDHNAKTLQRAGYRQMLNAKGKPVEYDKTAKFSGSKGDAAIYADEYAHDDKDACAEYFVFPEVFRDEVCRGFDHQAICRLLAERGCLVMDGRNQATRKWLPGVGNVRCYRITPKIFELDV